MSDNGLSNIQIEKYIRPILGQKFIGAVSKDEIPVIPDGYCVVCNTQDSVDGFGRQLPGTHWVAAGRHGNKSWYADSFGLAPLNALKNRLGNPIAYSARQIQDKKSTKCGYYAILACIQIQKSKDNAGDALTSYVDQFDAPLLYNNDKILMSVLRQIK